MYDLGLTVTGPILTDKLWFVGTLKRTFLDQLRVGSYNPDGTQFVDDNKMVTYSGKLSYAMSPTQPAALHLSLFEQAAIPSQRQQPDGFL